MRVKVYTPPENAWAQRLTNAIVAGFKILGDETKAHSSYGFDDAAIDKWPQIVVVCGTKHPVNRAIAKAYARAAKHVLIADTGYLDESQIRLALDGWHNRWMFENVYPTDRVDNLVAAARLKWQPIVDPAERQCITYIGPTVDFARWHEYGNLLEWDIKNSRGIVSATPGRFHTMFWRMFANNNRPSWVPQRTQVIDDTLHIDHYIQQSHVVITHCANSLSLRALIQGVPIIDTSPLSPLTGLVLNNMDKILNVTMTDEQRRQALARVSYHQFSLDELASGEGLKILEPYTVKRLEGKTSLTEQYQLMHENPKMYRGFMPKLFQTEITKLVHKYKAATLLDYGSGKGRQYSELQVHETWGGILPTCYDIGWPPFATKPEGTFDGVICTDMMEHIDPTMVDVTLLDVIKYANKFVFFCIFTDLATKNLPDGRNAHLTVRPPHWWNDALARALKAAEPKGRPVIETIDKETFNIFDGRREIVVFYRDVESGKKLKEPKP